MPFAAVSGRERRGRGDEHGRHDPEGKKSSPLTTHWPQGYRMRRLCSVPYRVERLDQHRVVALGGLLAGHRRDLQMSHGSLEDRCAQGSRQLLLLDAAARRHRRSSAPPRSETAAARSHGRESKRPSSRPASAMSRALWRVISEWTQAIFGPGRKPARLSATRQPRPGATDSPRPTNGIARQRAPELLLLPVLGGAAQHQPRDDVGMVARDQLRDRPAHRIAVDDHRPEPERANHRRRVRGAVLRRNGTSGRGPRP